MEYGAVKSVLVTVWHAMHTLLVWEVHVELVFRQLAVAPTDWFAVNVQQIILLDQ